DYAMLHSVAPPLWPDGSPIPPGQATKLLCGGEFHRIVFGPESEVLDSGRTRRLFTPAQTRAVIARDGHCQFPECTAPPEQGDIHHSIWWYHHGRTSIDNAILLCWYHHDYVHQHSISITSTARGWIFRRPDNGTISSAAAPAARTEWANEHTSRTGLLAFADSPPGRDVRARPARHRASDPSLGKSPAPADHSPDRRPSGPGRLPGCGPQQPPG